MITILLNDKPVKIVTITQLARMCNITNTTRISQLLSFRNNENGEMRLDEIYPFPHTNKPEDSRTGPRFVVWNKKCERLIGLYRK